MDNTNIIIITIITIIVSFYHVQPPFHPFGSSLPSPSYPHSYRSAVVVVVVVAVVVVVVVVM